MMSTILVTAIVTLFVSVAYGVLLSHKEESIRKYLREKAQGFLRSLYILAFVQGVNGRDHIADSGNIVNILLILCLAVGMSVYGFTKYIVNEYQSLTANVQETRNYNQDSAKNLKERKGKIETKLVKQNKKIKSLGATITKIDLFGDLMWYTFMAILYVGLIVWRPYLLMRRRFSYEMDRFFNRIQKLTTKDELARLAVLESKVRDKESLKEFIVVAKKVASRYEISEMVRSFDLWKDLNGNSV